MQTANTRELSEGELRRQYGWASDEEAMVNEIIGTVWHNQMDGRSRLRSAMGRTLNVLIFRGRRNRR